MNVLIVGIVCFTFITLVWLAFKYDRPISVKLWIFTLISPRRNDRTLHPPTVEKKSLPDRT
ncbi:hypothetical protein [Amycolatopsis lurida]|uniref:hypothetical protein n=1 Tax=Amycolatopsis lurida TaxID=31959 RepID=UPI003646520E